MADRETLLQDYALSLSELTFPARPIIDALTTIAAENTDVAAGIIDTIKSRIYKTIPDYKLPAIYLLDSICKSVGNPYNILVGNEIFQIYSKTYVLVDEKVRQRLRNMFETWKLTKTKGTGLPLFPADQMDKISHFLHAASPGNVHVSTTILSLPLKPPSIGSGPLTNAHLIADIDLLIPDFERQSDGKLQERLNALRQLRALLSSQALKSKDLLAIQTQLDLMKQQTMLPVKQNLQTFNGGKAQNGHSGPSGQKYGQNGQPYGGQSGQSYGQSSQNSVSYGQNIQNTVSYGQNGQNSQNYGQQNQNYGLNNQMNRDYGQSSQFNQNNGQNYGQNSQNNQNYPQNNHNYPQNNSTTPSSLPRTPNLPVASSVSIKPRVNRAPDLFKLLVASGIIDMDQSLIPGSKPTYSVIIPKIKYQKNAANGNHADYNGGSSKLLRSTEYETLKHVELTKISIELSEDLQKFIVSSEAPTEQLSSLLYSGKPAKCGTCGKRFSSDPEGVEKRRFHLDWHFRINKKLSSGLVVVQSRNWYLDDYDWVKFRDENLLEYATSGGADAGDNGDNEPSGPKEIPFVVIPSTETNMINKCQICHDQINATYDDDSGEWRWVNCIWAPGEGTNSRKIFHATCYDETLKKRRAEEDIGGAGAKRERV